MIDLRLYMAQRLSAMLLVPFVFVHLGVMIYAIDGGLSAGEILGRTQGSALWFAFYGLFVLAVSVHAAIGLRVILAETFGLNGSPLTGITWAIGLFFLVTGARAVMAVTLAGGGA